MSKHRTDSNHAEIKRAYVSLGCSVVDLKKTARDSPENAGVSDLLVGVAGTINELVEVKTEDGELRQSQIDFNRKWRGKPPHLVRNVDQVIDHVQLLRSKLRTP